MLNCDCLNFFDTHCIVQFGKTHSSGTPSRLKQIEWSPNTILPRSGLSINRSLFSVARKFVLLPKKECSLVSIVDKMSTSTKHWFSNQSNLASEFGLCNYFGLFSCLGTTSITSSLTAIHRISLLAAHEWMNDMDNLLHYLNVIRWFPHPTPLWKWWRRKRWGGIWVRGLWWTSVRGFGSLSLYNEEVLQITINWYID